MESTTRRKVTTIALASLMALTLAAGSAFAGRGQGAVNGNKEGVDNKKESFSCPDDYYLVYGVTNPADINLNGAYCQKWTGNADGYSYVDDSSGKWD